MRRELLLIKATKYASHIHLGHKFENIAINFITPRFLYMFFFWRKKCFITGSIYGKLTLYLSSQAQGEFVGRYRVVLRVEQNHNKTKKERKRGEDRKRQKSFACVVYWDAGLFTCTYHCRRFDPNEPPQD